LNLVVIRLTEEKSEVKKQRNERRTMNVTTEEDLTNSLSKGVRFREEEEEDNRSSSPTQIATESAIDDDDDDDSSSEDEDAHLKSIFRGGKKSSIRRTDSWENFMTRSQRNAVLGKDRPPSAEEARRRKVKFRADEKLEEVKEVEDVPEEDRPNYWLDNRDFDRFETEVKLTRFRWENHLSGKIKFDEENNSMRGLEYLQEGEKIDANRWKHARSVLGEIHRQKMAGRKQIDWEKVRETSSRLSSESSRRASELGKADEADRHRAWGEPVATEPSSMQRTKSEPALKKKKSRSFLNFLRKNST
jgi:hypothetical protein